MRPRYVLVVPIAFGLLAAEDAAWKTKSIPDWSAEDAQQVLTDSPWAKSVTPTLSRVASNPGSSPGRRGGFGGVGIGFPGGGMGRRGGYGYPGGGYPNDSSQRGDTTNSQTPPTLKVRWESALPVREAELKSRDTNAPTIGEDHYAIAVYGVPSRLINADSKTWADELKKDAALKREDADDQFDGAGEICGQKSAQTDPAETDNGNRRAGRHFRGVNHRSDSGDDSTAEQRRFVGRQ